MDKPRPRKVSIDINIAVTELKVNNLVEHAMVFNQQHQSDAEPLAITAVDAA